MRNNFKEWFRNNNTPEILIDKKCDALGWPDELKQDALFVV